MGKTQSVRKGYNFFCFYFKFIYTNFRNDYVRGELLLSISVCPLCIVTKQNNRLSVGLYQHRTIEGFF